MNLNPKTITILYDLAKSRGVATAKLGLGNEVSLACGGGCTIHMLRWEYHA